MKAFSRDGFNGDELEWNIIVEIIEDAGQGQIRLGDFEGWATAFAELEDECLVEERDCELRAGMVWPQ
jgi:hypothetical protein